MMKENVERLKPYLDALPDVLRYQIFTKSILGLWLFVLGRVVRVLLQSAGRVAVTSGDFWFLFTTWQGILILLIALCSLLVYISLDLNAQILLSDELLKGKQISVTKICWEAIKRIKHFLNIEGILVALYILLIAPILGFGLSISLTKGFYIPTFISSVIADTPLYLVLASLAALLFLSIGVANLYLLHGVIIDDLTIKESGIQSKKMIRKNWKDYLKQNIFLILGLGLILVVTMIVVLYVPLGIISVLPVSEDIRRFLYLFFVLAGALVSLCADVIVTPIYLMRMTQLYYVYKDGQVREYPQKDKRKRMVDIAVVGLVLVGVVILSGVLNVFFDQVFPQDSSVKVIAHRAGGVVAPENTVVGIEKASELGAYGSEIDIQRTKDGHYVVNHDDSFARTTGVKKKPGELTLEDIQQLSVDGQPVPTLEDMLDASKDRLILFIELKGKSADKQMVDDAIKIIQDKHMEDQVVLISLKYDLIQYIEEKYPEFQTGFLAFASFGDTELLDCDYIGLEEESASASTIASIHLENKKAMVWTPNEKDSQHYFLCSDADAIITDKISQAKGVKKEIHNRTDLYRIVDRIKSIIG